jgi:hypothetical protein
MKRDVLRHGARVALALAFTVTLLAQPVSPQSSSRLSTTSVGGRATST